MGCAVIRSRKQVDYIVLPWQLDIVNMGVGFGLGYSPTPLFSDTPSNCLMVEVGFSFIFPISINALDKRPMSDSVWPLVVAAKRVGGCDGPHPCLCRQGWYEFKRQTYYV